MASNIALTASMRQNLLSLQGTASLLDQTQNRLATGLKVNGPLDNPTNFFAASGMKLRSDDLSGLKDAMGNAVQTIKSATNGIVGMQALLNTAKGILEQARSAGAGDRAELGKQYDEILSQIDTLVTDSDFQGFSFLATASGSTVTLDVTFDNRSGHSSASKLTLEGFTAVHSALGSTGVSSANAVWSGVTGTALTQQLNSQAAQLSRAITFLQAKSSKLSANLAVISARLDFTNSMVNTLKEGADKLTLADMNEESANMLALQTRQNLGITSLSLASQANQSILRLF